MQQTEQNPQQPPEVMLAKTFFESEFDPANTAFAAPLNVAKNFTVRKTLTKDLLWDDAFAQVLPDGRIGVYVPLIYEQDFHLNTKWAALSLNSLSYALFFVDKNNEVSVEIITTFPNRKYLKANEEPAVFTGVVYVEDWNGNLIRSMTHHKNGTQLFEPDNANKTIAYCETITDWYSCGSPDGGDTWYCHYDYTDVSFGLCDDNGGGSSGTNYVYDQTYLPAIGSNGISSIGGQTAPEMADCPAGSIPDAHGNCMQVIVPCETDDPYLNNVWFQSIINNIWKASNAERSIPLNERNENGGWITDNGDGSFSFIPFPSSWIRTPCKIIPPENWHKDIPAGAFIVVHSHPFYEGEDTRNVCNEPENGLYADAEYTSGPSNDDKYFLLYHEMITGYQGFIGFVIDGSNITIFDRKLEGIEKIYNRCGY